MSDPRTAAFDAVLAAMREYGRVCAEAKGCPDCGMGLPCNHWEAAQAAVRRAVRALRLVELEAVGCIGDAEDVLHFHLEGELAGKVTAEACGKCATCARIAELQQEEA